MKITSDSHLHSAFSGDCDAPMEDMIRRGMALGFDRLCFTEHMDMDYPISDSAPEGFFVVDTEAYLAKYTRLRDKYGGDIQLGFGIELGLHPQHVNDNADYVRSHPFDMVIASTHIVNGKDPYLPEYFAGRGDKAAYREYFEASLENVRQFDDFDVYGHLDYVLRYGAEAAPLSAAREHFYSDHADVIEEILAVLVQKNKGLEINTSALRNRLPEPHPCAAILKRFRELGGECVSIGSDAHTPESIGMAFDRARDILMACGFSRHAIFTARKAEYVSL